MTQKELIRQEIERRIENYWSDGDVDSVVVSGELEELIDFIDSLPEEASCVYDTNKLTPTPSVNIEDVARVQFASHAHVFDRKRKAVFDWEQFKEVAGIFYGFGKRDCLPEEKPSEDLEEAANEYGRENVHYWYDEEIGDGAIYDDFEDLKVGFIAGAEWQYKNTITFLSEVMFQDMKKGICGWGEIPEKK